MKNAVFSTLFLLSISAAAQKGKSVKPAPAKKPAAAAPATILKTNLDSASYAIGLQVINYYRSQGITKLNTAAVTRAINDILGGKKPLIEDFAAQNALMRCMSIASEAKSKPNVQAGQAFLAKNKTKAGIKTTASGLQYEVLRDATGPKPTAADSVTVHYRGTLLNGTQFDASYDRGEPITFPLSGVIRGWTEGVQLMSVGSKYKFYIPQELAYGTQETGTIPPGSTLVFEVELLAIPSRK